MGSGCGRRALGTLGDKEGTPGGDKNPAQHRLNSALFTSHNTPGQGEEEMGRQSPSGPGGGHTQPQGTHTTPPTPEPPSRTPPCTQTPSITHTSPSSHCHLVGVPSSARGGFFGGGFICPLCAQQWGGPTPLENLGPRGLGKKNKPQKATGGGGQEAVARGGQGVSWHRAGQGPGGARGVLPPCPPPGSSSPL